MATNKKSATTARLAVGVVGLGAMGEPMACNLHEAGLLRGVWNRSPDKAQALGERPGVAVAETPAALAAACDALVLSVSRDADVLEVVEAVMAAAHPGLTVIDTSTVAADTARAAARRLAGRGARFLDAPVSGGVEGARSARLAMMVGGDADDLDKVKPVLEAVAARIVHMGPVGAGQATKAVNQLMAAGINQAVTEALAFGQAMELPMDRVIEVVGGGAAGNWFLDHRGASMLVGDYRPGFKVALHHKDLEICRRMMETLGEARLPLVEMTLVHYRRLVEAGHGEEDISALFREKRKLFGPGS
jgi:3-hydroxyisobutyrate dehydrogenase